MSIVKTKERVELHQLGIMLRLVAEEFPELTEYKDIAEAVSEYFEVICTEEDVIGYHRLHIEHEQIIHEDYELEAKRHEHKHYY